MQASDAADLLAEASELIAMKGKKINRFDVTKEVSDEAVQAMLGPTGNLRAPTLRKGKTLIVGFHEETYEKLFG